MARAHRIGQTREVRVLRLITASPIEEKILATANEKLTMNATAIEAGKFNQTSDATERREMLQRLIAQSADALEAPPSPAQRPRTARPCEAHREALSSRRCRTRAYRPTQSSTRCSRGRTAGAAARGEAVSGGAVRVVTRACHAPPLAG